MSTTPAAPKPAATKPPSRMKLSNVISGKLQEPWRILLDGVEGIGKTTLAADCPDPIFLGTEDGTGHLDVKRFAKPETFEDCLDAIYELRKGQHSFKTLVVDTVDHMEPLIWAHVCARDNQENIEGYGFGKGFQVALDEHRRFLKALEQLRAEKGMNILLLAHVAMRTFKNPEGPDFDRYELKLNLKAAGLYKEWVDAVLFANWDQFAAKKKNEKEGVFAKGKGVSTGARLLFTQRTAAYDAKNRFGLPQSLPLEWAALDQAMREGQPSTPADLIAEITRKAADLTAADKDAVTAALTRAGQDVVKLEQLNNWCNSKQAEQAGKAA